MQRSLGELIQECSEKGLLFCKNPAVKWGKREYIELLRNHNISELYKGKLSWGMRQRLKIQSPMLCFSFKNLKPAEQEACMTSSEWIAERKIDGCRLILTYVPKEGFGFFSRNVSVKDYLPVDYSDKILVWWKGEPRLASQCKGLFKKGFVLDCEVVCGNSSVDTTVYRGKLGTVTGTELNATTAILSIETEDSHRIQKEQSKLSIIVFDVLSFGALDVSSGTLASRIYLRNKIVSTLAERGLDIQLVDSVVDNKQDFYDLVVAEGGEGIVLKNLKSPYISTESRRRDGFVKRKRSMEESAGADIDAYITGFVASDSDKSWSRLIGALQMSVALINENGDIEETVIASVASMPLKLREAMTEIGVDGKPCLRKEFYNRVLVINGQDISPKSFRFMHATADWKRGFREDKSFLDCRMEKEFLLSQVL